MRNPYSKNNSVNYESLKINEQVAFIFQKILENLEKADACYKEKMYEKSAEHGQTVVNLSVALGNILNPNIIAIGQESTTPLQEAPWQEYFNALILTVGRYFINREERLFQALCKSLKEMIETWSEFTPAS